MTDPTRTQAPPSIAELPSHVGETVTLKGWLYHKRAGGKIRFLVLRDGSGYVQAIVYRPEVSDAVWEASRITPRRGRTRRALLQEGLPTA